MPLLRQRLLGGQERTVDRQLRIAADAVRVRHRDRQRVALPFGAFDLHRLEGGGHVADLRLGDCSVGDAGAADSDVAIAADDAIDRTQRGGDVAIEGRIPVHRIFVVMIDNDFLAPLVHRIPAAVDHALVGDIEVAACGDDAGVIQQAVGDAQRHVAARQDAGACAFGDQAVARDGAGDRALAEIAVVGHEGRGGNIDVPFRIPLFQAPPVRLAPDGVLIRRRHKVLPVPARLIEGHGVAAILIRQQREIVDPQIGQRPPAVAHTHLRAFGRRVDGQQGAVWVALGGALILEREPPRGRRHAAQVGVDLGAIGTPVVVVAMPLGGRICLRIPRNRQAFAQILQALGFDRRVAIGFNEAGTVLQQIAAAQVQRAAAIQQAAIPVAQSFARQQRQLLRRGHHAIAAMVVDHAATHDDVIAHHARGVVQRIDIERHAVGFQPPLVAQDARRHLQALGRQGARVGQVRGAHGQIAWQQPFGLVGQRAIHGKRDPRIAADRVTGLVGVVLPYRKRQRVLAAQGARPVVQGMGIDGQRASALHQPVLVEQEQRGRRMRFVRLNPQRPVGLDAAVSIVQALQPRQRETADALQTSRRVVHRAGRHAGMGCPQQPAAITVVQPIRRDIQPILAGDVAAPAVVQPRRIQQECPGGNHLAGLIVQSRAVQRQGTAAMHLALPVIQRGDAIVARGQADEHSIGVGQLVRGHGQRAPAAEHASPISDLGGNDPLITIAAHGATVIAQSSGNA
ncbi:Uncharacterised protein [Achromobacter ruhlandii]|nr:Uncharacterised protein [Achromobacter ruhlandii]